MAEKPKAPETKASQPAKAGQFDLLVPIRTADDLMRDELTAEMQELARTDPERVAQLLREWMARR